MKTAAVLCICLTLGIVQDAQSAGGSLQIFQNAIKRLKQETNTVIRDLKRLEGNAPWELERQLNDIKFQSMTSVNQAVNSALTDIRAQVDKAKSQGKNVEHCYENAKQNLRTISQKGFADLDQCVKSNVATMDPTVNNIAATVGIANKILIELDSIFINCYSSSIMAMESCIASKMPGANMAVKNLKSTADSLQDTVHSVTRTATSSGRSCMFDADSKTRDGALQVRFAANTCVGA